MRRDHPKFFISCPMYPLQVVRKAEEEKSRKARVSEIRTGVSFAAAARSLERRVKQALLGSIVRGKDRSGL